MSIVSVLGENKMDAGLGTFCEKFVRFSFGNQITPIDSLQPVCFSIFQSIKVSFGPRSHIITLIFLFTGALSKQCMQVGPILLWRVFLPFCHQINFLNSQQYFFLCFDWNFSFSNNFFGFS